MQLVECVPNFSEGRRAAVVEQITAEIRAIEGVHVLDVSMDPDHNRAVVAFAGSPKAAAEAAVRATARASKLIDMTRHHGAHPRFGATDVVPFVPVIGISMVECVQLARQVAQRIGEEVGIPVYLYAEAALHEYRRRLVDVRRGEYEGLAGRITQDKESKPDFGPCRVNEAGAVAVGAREALVAYNVNLATTDVSIAKAIARSIRESSGGLPAVQALGFALPKRQQVQVSMNLLDYQKTPPHAALRAVRREAEARGVALAGAELVGIIPVTLLCAVAGESLALEGLPPKQVLEHRWLAEL